MASLGSPRIDSGATAVSISVTMVVAGPSHGAVSHVTAAENGMQYVGRAVASACLLVSPADVADTDRCGAGFY